jgi:hypothetical protein
MVNRLGKSCSRSAEDPRSCEEEQRQEGRTGQHGQSDLLTSENQTLTSSTTGRAVFSALI